MLCKRTLFVLVGLTLGTLAGCAGAENPDAESGGAAATEGEPKDDKDVTWRSADGKSGLFVVTVPLGQKNGEDLFKKLGGGKLTNRSVAVQVPLTPAGDTASPHVNQAEPGVKIKFRGFIEPITDILDPSKFEGTALQIPMRESDLLADGRKISVVDQAGAGKGVTYAKGSTITFGGAFAKKLYDALADSDHKGGTITCTQQATTYSCSLPFEGSPGVERLEWVGEASYPAGTKIDPLKDNSNLTVVRMGLTAGEKKNFEKALDKPLD